MHELDFTTGRAAVAYTGKVPWHGFGEPMDEEQPLDAWRVAAGLDWEVTESPIFMNQYLKFEYDGDITTFENAGERGRNHLSFKPIPKKKVLSRSDNGAPLSVVSNRFKVVQPAQIIKFFKHLIDHNGFKMSTAGSLRGGQRIWALADCGRAFTLGGDRVGAHLLLATAYDGTFSTTAQFTSIRTVCNNTLEFGMRQGASQGGCIKIPHTQDFNEYDIRGELGLDAGWSAFKNNIIWLQSRTVTKREAIEYFLTVCGVSEQEAADGKQMSNVKKLLSFYEAGPGAQLPSAKDTAWGLVNAVTYLADHGRRSKDNGSRFDSASFGSGALMKRKAMTEALALAAA